MKGKQAVQSGQGKGVCTASVLFLGDDYWCDRSGGQLDQRLDDWIGGKDGWIAGDLMTQLFPWSVQ